MSLPPTSLGEPSSSRVSAGGPIVAVAEAAIIVRTALAVAVAVAAPGLTHSLCDVPPLEPTP